MRTLGSFVLVCVFVMFVCLPAIVADGADAPAPSDTWLASSMEMVAAKEAGDAEATSQPGVSKDAGENNTEALLKAAQNPVADMISVPLQSNFNFYDIHTRFGPREYTRHTMGYVLNVQPVIPFELNEDWNLITRTIVPIVNQPQLVPGMGSHGGLGDVQLSLFLAPSKPSKFIWGAGPALMFPTATDRWLGTGKWSAGPGAVGLWMDGPWVVGALVQNVWSYCGESGRARVNQFMVQPFINYNLPKGWYLTTSPIITSDWTAESSQRWTIPVGGGLGKLFRVGKLPVNAQLGGYYNVEHPTFGPEWSIRFQIQFLFPK